MEDRKVYLDPNATDIPCGFLAPSDLDKVRAYFQRDQVCKLLVYTLLFNAYNFVHNPISKDPNFYGDPSVCFILLTDNATIMNGHGISDIAPGVRNRSGKFRSAVSDVWQIILMSNLQHKTPAHATKFIKLSAPMLFPNANWIVYVDTKYVVYNHPQYLVNYFKDVTNDTYSLGAYAKFYHSLSDEFRGAKKRIVIQGYPKGLAHYQPEVDEVNRQQALYKKEGLFEYFPKSNVTSMIDAAILIIRNDLRAKRFFCAWMNEVSMFSRRDQLALHNIRYRLQVSIHQIWEREMMGRPHHFFINRRGEAEHPPKWNLYNDSNPHPFVLHPSTTSNG
jgi:hypothetical protein